MIQIANVSDIKSHMSDLQAVIFGLDNILYPLDDYVQSGFHQISRLFLGHGQEVYEQLWNAYRERGVTKAGMGKADIDTVNGEYTDIDDAVVGAIHAMLRQNGLDSDELAEKCLRIYEQHRPNIQPYDGVVDLLKELREKGLRLGLLVDGQPEMQREKIRALGIVPLFDEIILADDIAGHGDVMKFRTPNPICFKIMSLRLDVPLEKMGAVGATLRSDIKLAL